MKYRIPLLCALSLLWVAAQVPSAHGAIQDGLVSYWPLNATPDGLITPDMSANSNHLSLVGTPSFVTGTNGNAVSLNGVDQYLNLVYATDNGLPIYNSGYYTICFWVRDNKFSSGTNQLGRTVFSEANNAAIQALFEFRTDYTAGAASARTNLFAARIRDNFNGEGANGNTFFGVQTFGNQGKSTLMPFDGNWHHVAWVDSNGVARLYVDGVLDPRVFNDTRLLQPPDKTAAQRGLTLSTIALGAIFQNGAAVANTFFAGQIDDVAVWARTLSQTEINQVRTNANVVLAGSSTPVAPSIINQPVGNTNLVANESWAFQAFGLGTHPFTYQWYSNNVALADGNEITGSTAQILSLTNLPAGYAGNYSVVVSSLYGSVTSSPAALLVNTVTPQAPNLTNGQLAYWPLDVIQSGTTPDIVGGYDMFVNNVVANAVYSTNAGRWSSAVQFSGGVSCLLRIFSPSDALPLSKYPEYSVSMWVKGDATIGGMRFFAMGNTANTTPWLSLANPDNAGQGALSAMRAFSRNDNNQNNGTAGPGITTQSIFDSTWHHVVYVQRVIGGASPIVQGLIYIDGTNDVMVSQALPRQPTTTQIMAIGGSVRNTTSILGTGGTRAAMVGAVDDVAVWNRALTPLEIFMLTTNTVPPAPPTLPPLVINKFNADFAATVSGDSATLRWAISGSPLTVTINGNNVFGLTTNGLGTLVINNITATTNFTLIASRLGTSVTNTTTVTAVNGIGAGWHILDDFRTYSPGPLVTPANPYWSDLNNGCSIVTVSGKNMLNAAQGNGAIGQVAVLPLGGLTITQGQARTLFCRIYIQDDPAGTTVQGRIGFTDKGMKDARDTILDTGPVARFYTDSGPQLAVGAYSGVNGPLNLFPYKLEFQQVYNVWIDITNAPFNGTSSGDFYSIWIQRLGTPSRTLVLSGYEADRDLLPDFLGGGDNPSTLTQLIVANANSTGTIYLSDVYLSASGFSSAEPVAWTGATPPTLAQPTFAADTDFTVHPGQIWFTWDAGALMSAPTPAGPWSLVTDSFGFFHMLPFDTSDPERYFRIQR